MLVSSLQLRDSISLSFFVLKMAKTTEYHRNHRYGKNWKVIFERDKSCMICGSNKNLCIDHIIPVRLGGKSTLENMRVLCKSCNTKEGHTYRDLDPKIERKRNYMREWAKRHPGYFTQKSKEFRSVHIGYNNQDSDRIYRQAII